MPEMYDFVAIGGGAAGYFGAIAYAEACPGETSGRVLILEKTGAVLSKVKISGGGRCNTTHHCFEPKALSQHYPRGEKSLIGAFHRWGVVDTIEWFRDHGVELKTEDDGRMFPSTNTSETIIECFQDTAARLGIETNLRSGVEVMTPIDEGFRLELKGGQVITARSVLLASGGVRNGAGQRLAGELGHRVIPPAPSLFTFHIDDPRLAELSGVAVNRVGLRTQEGKLASEGPCLITHWGLSGPAVLKLSAWGARVLADCDYQFALTVDWTGGAAVNEVEEWFRQARERFPKRKVRNGIDGIDIPNRLWQRLVELSDAGEVTWSNLSRSSRQQLVEMLTRSEFSVQGKSMNKDEFVTAGGVDLKEVQFKTMESKLCPGLYFAGEVLDIDGITGGFNFQAAWTTARIAGTAAAERSLTER